MPYYRYDHHNSDYIETQRFDAAYNALENSSCQIRRSPRMVLSTAVDNAAVTKWEENMAGLEKKVGTLLQKLDDIAGKMRVAKPISAGWR